MATFTLDQYLGLAWEILALLASVAKLWAEMLTITSFLVARLLTRLCFTGLLAGPFMTLKTTFMVTRKSLRAFSQAKGLSSTCSLDLFLSTPTSNCDIFETFTGTIVAIILAFMATCHLSITNILALGNYWATYDGRSHESFSTGTWLRLTINDWAFFTKANVTRLSAFVFATVQHLGAVEITRVICWNRWISMRAARFIAKVISTISLFLADKLTFKRVVFHLRALDFAGLMTTSAVLVCDNLTRPAGTLMATVRADMSTI